MVSAASADPTAAPTTTISAVDVEDSSSSSLSPLSLDLYIALIALLVVALCVGTAVLCVVQRRRRQKQFNDLPSASSSHSTTSESAVPAPPNEYGAVGVMDASSDELPQVYGVFPPSQQFLSIREKKKKSPETPTYDVVAFADTSATQDTICTDTAHFIAFFLQKSFANKQTFRRQLH